MKSNDIAKHPKRFLPPPRFAWPQKCRCAAMLCFDVDGETTALSEDLALTKRRTLMSQCEYGPCIGVPRLLGLLKHLQVPATFFVPGRIAEDHPRMVEAIISEEIASTKENPSAMRRPVKMSGSACGRNTRNSMLRVDVPSASAPHTSTRGVDAMPWNVCTIIGSRQARNTAQTVVVVPIPNHRMNSGISADFGSE